MEKKISKKIEQLSFSVNHLACQNGKLPHKWVKTVALQNGCALSFKAADAFCCVAIHRLYCA